MPLIPLMVCVLYFRSEYFLRDTQLSGACENVKFFLFSLSACRFYITEVTLERWLYCTSTLDMTCSFRYYSFQFN